ncbi:hypothetical protein [Klebsiella pneumoniae]|uniref:hypothetical protein n=1 Tax=Klebsiella pneumoniae TaxID=573 RepID=UPI00355657CE
MAEQRYQRRQCAGYSIRAWARYDITVSTDTDDLVSVPQFTPDLYRPGNTEMAPAGQLCSITISLTAIYFYRWAQKRASSTVLLGKYRTGLLPPFDGRPLF